MPKKKSSLGPIWAVVIAGALLLVVVQFLPDKAGAQKLAHFFIAIAIGCTSEQVGEHQDGFGTRRS